MLVSASGRCFCLLYEPPQSRSSLLRSQTNDGCMPCHHHGTVGDTGNFHQGFLYLLGTFFGIFRHCRQTGGCLLPCTAAKKLYTTALLCYNKEKSRYIRKEGFLWKENTEDITV